MRIRKIFSSISDAEGKFKVSDLYK